MKRFAVEGGGGECDTKDCFTAIIIIRDKSQDNKLNTFPLVFKWLLKWP